MLSTILLAQAPTLSTTDFLAAALQHPHLKLHQNTAQYLKNTNHELPILEKLEFRTETNDFKINKQEYALRFDFSTTKERAAQRALHQSNVNYYTVEEQLFLEEILEERYENLVELCYQKRLISALEQQKILYQDKLLVLQKSIQSTDFDIDELIETEEDLQNLEQNLLEFYVKNQQLKEYLQQETPKMSSFDINKNTWLSVEDIQQRFQNPKTDTLLNRPVLQQRLAEIQQIEKEYEFEKAQAQNLINYAQLKYNSGEDFVYKHFSVGIGILFPLKSTSLLDLNELELERLENTNFLEIEKTDIQRKTKQVRAKIDLFAQQYQLLQNQIKDNQTAYTLEQYSKIEGISPLALLKLKELLLKKEWSILKIEYELFQFYVEYLVLSGQMMELPLRDYLSKDLKQF